MAVNFTSSDSLSDVQTPRKRGKVPLGSFENASRDRARGNRKSTTAQTRAVTSSSGGESSDSDTAKSSPVRNGKRMDTPRQTHTPNSSTPKSSIRVNPRRFLLGGSSYSAPIPNPRKHKGGSSMAGPPLTPRSRRRSNTSDAIETHSSEDSPSAQMPSPVDIDLPSEDGMEPPLRRRGGGPVIEDSSEEDVIPIARRASKHSSTPSRARNAIDTTSGRPDMQDDSEDEPVVTPSSRRRLRQKAFDSAPSPSKDKHQEYANDIEDDLLDLQDTGS